MFRDWAEKKITLSGVYLILLTLTMNGIGNWQRVDTGNGLHL
jgi:hypothetical protein